MGLTIEPLAKRQLSGKAIFNNRMVVEICEKVHFHYRNFRIVQSLDDFINMAEGISAALERWKKRGCPGTGSRHIELCRKNVAVSDFSDTVEINLNENLYKKNEGGIFAEGANFTEDRYVHFKLRDTRIELSLAEFNEVAEAIKEAQAKLSATIPSFGVYA